MVSLQVEYNKPPLSTGWVQLDNRTRTGSLVPRSFRPPDKALNIPERVTMNERQRELEAESVAYVVCARNGIRSRPETYLAHYVTEWTTIDAIDVYQVTRAAGGVPARTNGPDKVLALIWLKQLLPVRENEKGAN